MSLSHITNHQIVFFLLPPAFFLPLQSLQTQTAQQHHHHHHHHHSNSSSKDDKRVLHYVSLRITTVTTVTHYGTAALVNSSSSSMSPLPSPPSPSPPPPLGSTIDGTRLICGRYSTCSSREAYGCTVPI